MTLAFYREGSARGAMRPIYLRGEGVVVGAAAPGSGILASVEGRVAMIGRAKNVSEQTRLDAGLSDSDLWLRYFGLGGMGTPDQVRSYLRRGAVPSVHDHDVLAQALNERFSELGRNRPVRYAGVRR